MVLQEQRELQDLQELKEQMVLQEQRELQDLQELQDQMVLQEQRDLQDLQERLNLMEELGVITCFGIQIPILGK
jgi:hypothetical protein